MLAPSGTRIAFTGGTDCNDHTRIWEALDKIRAKHPDMVLLHGGSPRGAERIAACWADNRKVPQVVFKPDWTRDRNAAPFKRNDRMLEALPIGVVVFPGSGIAANLADKARKLGIPTWRFDQPAPAKGPGLERGPSPRAAPLRRRRHPPQTGGAPVIDAGAVGGSRLTTSRRSGSAAFHAGTLSRVAPALVNLSRIAHS